MHCITNSEIDVWLVNRSIPKDPYHSGVTPKFYLQFYAPKTWGQREDFIRRYFELISPEIESLIHLTDWSGYMKEDMNTVQDLRRSYGEERPIIEAPGHTLDDEERAIGIKLFSLAASFGWSSYYYNQRDRSTLYNWEGDILDLWTDSKRCYQRMKKLILELELSETKK